MSFVALEEALYDVISPILVGTNIIRGYQNGPELATPYCVYYTQTMDATGREDTAPSADLSGAIYNLRTVEHYLATVRFEFTGKDTASNHGGDLAMSFLTALSTPNVQLELRKKNLGYMSKSLLRRIPKLRETAWYNAYVVDVVFSFALETIQQVDIIENVVLDSTYDSITTIVDTQTIP